jgi:nicotinate-nucleotide pyrophosphorylase (carboxylating)
MEIGQFSNREREEFILLLEKAIQEDGEDVTSAAVIPAQAAAGGVVVARDPCRVAGLPAAAILSARFDLTFRPLVGEGADVDANTEIVHLAGTVRQVLRAERILLNFLSRLSGVATLTRRYVESFRPTPVYDTRKTTPGWRHLEKYAVRVGGGRNHRLGLDDQILVKDNHFAALLALGEEHDLGAVISRARRFRDARPERLGLAIEVEVLTLADFQEAVRAGADIVMLDNWTTEAVVAALEWIPPQDRRRVQIELSGGITLQRAPELAGLGADRVSVGALTHAVTAVDFSLDIKAA